MRLLAVVPAICAVLIGMATPGSAQPAAPVAIPEAPPGTPAAMFVDDPTIVNGYPTRPQSWSRVVGDGSVRLHFTVGTPDCYGVTAAVHETADEVVVDLRSGTLPQAVDRACIAIALFGGLDVPLREPLGPRRVLSLT
jgi:transcriptional regulator of nitric oxide reductase